ncbi:MAG: S-layer family protein [Oscillatoriales cyanobacterium C42_A2020_001]|nr:S-layer family protein [Leptolyngbyaceae cyanobacterium C42_A2020_001]
MRTYSTVGNGGAVTIAAAGDVTATGTIDTNTVEGNSGNVSITANGNTTLNSISTYNDVGNGGSVEITVAGDVRTTGTIDTSTIDGNSGKVTITAKGTVTPGIIDTSIYGSGEAGDIDVSARSLFLNNGAQILSISKYGATGNSGDITINTRDTVRLSGVGPGDAPSAIFTLADLYSTGNGGNITINTGSLVLRDGSEILANHFGDGVNTRAGNITIRARDMVSLEGFRVRAAEADSPGTGIGSNVSFGGINKQGGTIDIQAGGLELLNGAYISTSLERRANGQGGNILLNVSNQNTPGNVVIAGSATRESGIFSRTEATSIGNGGNIQLNAGSVSLRDNAIIGAETNNLGNSGRIGINATSLSVSARASITAETTTAGNAGEIIFLGDRLTLIEGGQIRTGTSGAGQAGAIAIGSINAPVNQVDLRDPDSGIFTNTQRGSSGNGGNITLDAGTLVVSNQAQINASTSGQGTADNVTIRTTDTTLRDGSITIGVTAGGSGSGGVIDVQTRSLVLVNRGRIQSLTLGSGRAGDIQVQAEAIAISDPFSGIISGSSTPGRQGQGIGDGGNIRLTAETLRIFNEGIVSASTFSNGRSGKIDVVANVVELTSQGKLSATTQGSGDAGSITVTAGDRVTIAGEGSGMFANTTPQSLGNGGSIFVTTGDLLLQDQGRITAESRGRGKGGDIQLSANQIELSDRAAIFAETASTQGGNIQLQVQDLLLLRRNSLISASAGTAQAGGNGGNITINAGFVIGVLSENSDISANAFTGNGGKVNITAQGIFGLQFRPKLTPFSDITASSQFGISGTVTLNTLNIDPNRGLVQLPSDFTDSTNQIAQTCSPQQRNNSFVVTGRGG